jgi:23S rRNA pseudouridine955/2504/2580 synthase
MLNIEIPKIEDGSRLDRCLRRLLGNINQSNLEKLLRSGNILLEKKKTKSSVKVRTGQFLSYSDHIVFEKEYKKDKFSISTKKYYNDLYNEILINQTEDWLAINKPNGLAVQGGSSQIYHVDNMLNCVFNNKEVPKLVHRLDKDTSGILLIAKHQKSAQELTKYFKDHKIIKTYLAIVSPAPHSEQGLIDLPLIKTGVDGNQKVKIDKIRGKEALTEYKVLDRVGSRIALVALSPKTGRTHQLRVHLESLNSPIVGDTKYKGNNSIITSNSSILKHESINKIKWNPIDQNNLQLHALSLMLPSNELIEAKLPEQFKQNMKFIGLTLPKNVNKLFLI